MPDPRGQGFRVAVIGFGRAGALHAQAWRDCPGVELAGACDPDAAARRGAAELGIPAFRDLDEMLEATRPDAVSVCTPPACHGELAARCLKRGLHVLCEKPLITDLAFARQLWDVAAQANRRLLVAAKYRHVPELRMARELMRSGEIGAVRDFRIEFASAAPMANRWHSKRAISGGGVIMDNGWHAFDLIHYVFGGIRRVRARAENGPQGLEVEESARIDIVAAGGETGQVVLSWSAPSRGDAYVSIRGERGDIHVGWKRSRLERGAAASVDFGQAYDKVAAHRRMMASFLEIVAGRQQPWLSREESLGIAAAIEAAYRSCASRREQAVVEPHWITASDGWRTYGSAALPNPPNRDPRGRSQHRRRHLNLGPRPYPPRGADRFGVYHRREDLHCLRCNGRIASQDQCVRVHLRAGDHRGRRHGKCGSRLYQ